MIDNVTLLFTTVMIALVLIRATRMDREWPWFGDRTPDKAPPDANDPPRAPPARMRRPRDPDQRDPPRDRPQAPPGPAREPWDDVRR